MLNILCHESSVNKNGREGLIHHDVWHFPNVVESKCRTGAEVPSLKIAFKMWADFVGEDK